MIYGAMRDKAVEEIAGILFPLASELILTAPDNARALRPEALREIAGRGHIAPDISSAVEGVRGGVSEDDAVIITGSLFLVGEARALSYNKHSWPFSGAWSS
jgi:dihydrofolate synthase/folylpolyglutamate synthase